MSDIGPNGIPESRNNAALIGAAIGLGVIGLVVLLALVFRGDDDAVQTATSTTVGSSSTAAATSTTAVTSTSTTVPSTTVLSTTVPSTTVPSTTSSTTSTSTTTPSGGGVTPLAVAPGPGQYCYRSQEGESESNYRVTFVADGTFAGDGRISVVTDEYHAFGIEQFDGTFALTGATNATAEITTWVEADVQNNTASWTFGETQLATRNDVLTLTDCAVVDQAFQDVDGLEVADLFDGVTVRVLEEVKFAPGGTSGSVDNAVISGERDVYELEASSGQQMEIEITSLEDNAVFSVIGPGGFLLANEETSVSLVLPHTGVYLVVVGGTRGNATYEATFSIS